MDDEREVTDENGVPNDVKEYVIKRMTLIYRVRWIVFILHYALSAPIILFIAFNVFFVDEADFNYSAIATAFILQVIVAIVFGTLDVRMRAVVKQIENMITFVNENTNEYVANTIKYFVLTQYFTNPFPDNLEKRGATLIIGSPDNNVKIYRDGNDFHAESSNGGYLRGTVND